MDESSGVVASAVDPDNTPIDKLIALIREDVGLLSARDERLIRAVEAHRARVDERRRPGMPMPEVDRAKLASLLEHDMTGWPPFKDQAARLAKLEAAEAARAKPPWWRKLVWGSGIVSGSTVLALLVWIGSSLDARAYENAQERLRVERLNDHHVVIDSLKSWRAGADARLNALESQMWGWLRRGRTRDGDTP